jgi:hypothetical protein
MSIRTKSSPHPTSRRRFRPAPAEVAPNKTIPNNGRPHRDATSSICCGLRGGTARDDADAANVTVTCKVLVLFPLASSVIDAGENVQVAPVGKF